MAEQKEPEFYSYIAKDPAGNIASRGIVPADRVERTKSHLAQDLLTAVFTPVTNVDDLGNPAPIE